MVIKNKLKRTDTLIWNVNVNFNCKKKEKEMTIQKICCTLFVLLFIPYDYYLNLACLFIYFYFNYIEINYNKYANIVKFVFYSFLFLFKTFFSFSGLLENYIKNPTKKMNTSFIKFFILVSFTFVATLQVNMLFDLQ